MNRKSEDLPDGLHECRFERVYIGIQDLEDKKGKSPDRFYFDSWRFPFFLLQVVFFYADCALIKSLAKSICQVEFDFKPGQFCQILFKLAGADICESS